MLPISVNGIVKSFEIICQVVKSSCFWVISFLFILVRLVATVKVCRCLVKILRSDMKIVDQLMEEFKVLWQFALGHILFCTK